MTSVSSLGTSPMVKIQTEPQRRPINKIKTQKRSNKMKKFRDMAESPVGKVGRTKDSEALKHIEDSNLAKRFIKIVKELGGKSVARQLLAGMDNSGNRVSVSSVTETSETPEKYLRSSGFKIKNEYPLKNGKELEFFKSTIAEEAFEDLKDAGFMDKYSIDLSNTSITYILI